MQKQLILLSGPICSGKSTLATTLEQRFGVLRYKTQDMIRKLKGTELNRLALQRAGEALDKQTNGAWIAKILTAQVLDLPSNARILVDAVRLRSQIDMIRKAFGPSVVHVHLTAPENELAQRHGKRQTDMHEPSTYTEVRTDPTEAAVEDLGELADVVINTLRSTPEDVVVRVAAQLGFYGQGYERLVDVVVGGEFGSEGKGQISAYLAPEYDVLVRVGGPNAGHKVYEEPEVHTFHHLPSGTMRNQAAQIILGAGAVVNVPNLLKEVVGAGLSVDRFSIDPQAMLISEADRIEERELTNAIGSTGSGVGVATARKVLRDIAKRPVQLAKHSPELRPYVRDTQALLDTAYARGQRVFLEGTQGTGLSLHHGFYPFVTSRDTTVGGCLGEAGIPPTRVRRSIMVCRTYPIRVESPQGATSGPMSHPLTWREISERSGIPEAELLQAERTSTTNKQRRIGEFDWALLRRAASLNGPTDIALTFADYLTAENRKARRFEQLSDDTIRFIEDVERVAAAPVSLIAVRFAFRSIIDRRHW